VKKIRAIFASLLIAGSTAGFVIPVVTAAAPATATTASVGWGAHPDHDTWT
jgi:hypothetical protein